MTPLGYLFLIGGILVIRQAFVGRITDLPGDARDLALAFLAGDMPAVTEVMARRGPPPDPSSPTAGGPVGEEGTTDYNLGRVSPRLVALVNELGPKFGIKTVGGYRSSARDPNGHPAGLAADFMVSGFSQGDALAAYARQNAARLGVDYIIWRQRIWSVSRSGEGWRAMEDRGSPSQNHMDHVHINVLPG